MIDVKINPNGKDSRVELSGNVIEIITDVQATIKVIYDGLMASDKRAAEIFRKGVADLRDSKLWDMEQCGSVVDLSALARAKAPVDKNNMQDSIIDAFRQAWEAKESNGKEKVAESGSMVFSKKLYMEKYENLENIFRRMDRAKGRQRWVDLADGKKVVHGAILDVPGIPLALCPPDCSIPAEEWEPYKEEEPCQD